MSNIARKQTAPPPSKRSKNLLFLVLDRALPSVEAPCSVRSSRRQKRSVQFRIVRNRAALHTFYENRSCPAPARPPTPSASRSAPWLATMSAGALPQWLMAPHLVGWSFNDTGLSPSSADITGRRRLRDSSGDQAPALPSALSAKRTMDNRNLIAAIRAQSPFWAERHSELSSQEVELVAQARQALAKSYSLLGRTCRQSQSGRE